MENLYIKLPPNLDAATVTILVDEVCAATDLRVTMKSTLKKYSGSIHWHLKQDDVNGILEITWWPREGDMTPPLLWLSVHRNRTADWIERVKPKVQSMIVARLVEKDIS